MTTPTNVFLLRQRMIEDILISATMAAFCSVLQVRRVVAATS